MGPYILIAAVILARSIEFGLMATNPNVTPTSSSGGAFNTLLALAVLIYAAIAIAFN